MTDNIVTLPVIRVERCEDEAVESPEITMRGVFSMQVCIPDNWDDHAVKRFADRSNVCGTEYGWHVRKKGDKALAGSPERIQCESRPGYVHIMLDA